jgi:protein O-mannosyl-transferase
LKTCKSQSSKVLDTTKEKFLSTRNVFKNKWLVVIVIAAATFLAYYPSLQNGFVDNDDGKSVYENNLVKSLSTANVETMFTSYLIGNYVPFVSLSFALDYQLYNLNAYGYHITSLILHCISVILIFFFFFRLSRDIWVGAIVALLFGIHPMHVESVSWVSERKDQLYVLFYVAAMLTYLSYLQKREIKWLLLTGFLFIISLLSKGQAVTLPLVLVLIDYYEGRKINAKIIFEKIPFIILSIVFGIIAFFAQQSEGLVGSIPLSFTDKILFACSALVRYLTRLVLPVHISAFYPYPPKISGVYPLSVYMSIVIVAALIGIVLWRFRKNKIVVFGALFFFFNVVLILQLLPVGDAIIADRYSYLSYTGLFFIEAVIITKYLRKSGSGILVKIKPLMVLGLCAYFIFIFSATYARTMVWKNGKTLWNDILNKEPTCWRAYNHLGIMYLNEGKYDSALFYFNGAVSVLHISLKSYAHEKDTNYICAYTYLDRGSIYSFLGGEKTDSAISDFITATKYEPKWYVPYQDLGVLYMKNGQYNLSIQAFSQCLKDNPPDSANIHYDIVKEYAFKTGLDSAVHRGKR